MVLTPDCVAVTLRHWTSCVYACGLPLSLLADRGSEWHSGLVFQVLAHD